MEISELLNEHDLENAREQLEIAIARNDLKAFSKFGWKDFPDHFNNAAFHDELYDILQYKSELGKLFQKSRRLHLEAPREHAKTTCTSVKHILWKLGRDPNLRFLIVSKTATLAMDILRENKQNIESNQQLHKVFPNLKPASPWSDTQLMLKRSRIDKTPSVRGVGLGGSITGGRADIIILDDPFDEENIRTKNQRQKVEQWIEKVVIPVLTPTGIAIFIGTRWHQDDYWGKLINKSIEQGGDYVVKIFRAIQNPQDRPEEWKTLWPEKWGALQLLRRKREIGPLRFNCLYQNDPSGYEGVFFKKSWIAHYNPDILLSKKDLHLYQAIDPSIGESPESDETAIATIGHDWRRGDIYVLDMWASSIDFPEQVRKVGEMGNRSTWSLYPFERKPRKIGIESIIYQSALAKTAYMQGLPIIELKSLRKKVERLLDLQPYFETGRLLFPDPDKVRTNWYDRFMEQYVTYPRGTRDDMLDALDHAVSLVALQREPAFAFGGGRRR